MCIRDSAFTLAAPDQYIPQKLMKLLLRKGAERRLSGRQLRRLANARIVEITDAVGLAGKLIAHVCENVAKGLSALRGFLDGGKQPVSYTHLDVYKRQV